MGVFRDGRWYYIPEQDAVAYMPPGEYDLGERPEPSLVIHREPLIQLVRFLDDHGYLTPRLDERLRQEDLKITHRLLDILERVIVSGADRDRRRVLPVSNQDLFHGYAVLISPLSKEDGGGWYGEVPQLKGCITSGDSPEEVFYFLQDAIDCWLEVARDESKPISDPQPLVIDEVERNTRWELAVEAASTGAPSGDNT